MGPRGGLEPRTGLRTSSPRALTAYCTPAAAPRPPPPRRAVRGSQDPWLPQQKLWPKTLSERLARPALQAAPAPGADQSGARGGGRGRLSPGAHHSEFAEMGGRAAVSRRAPLGARGGEAAPDADQSGARAGGRGRLPARTIRSSRWGGEAASRRAPFGVRGGGAAVSRCAPFRSSRGGERLLGDACPPHPQTTFRTLTSLRTLRPPKLLRVGSFQIEGQAPTAAHPLQRSLSSANPYVTERAVSGSTRERVSLFLFRFPTSAYLVRKSGVTWRRVFFFFFCRNYGNCFPRLIHRRGREGSGTSVRTKAGEIKSPGGTAWKWNLRRLGWKPCRKEKRARLPARVVRRWGLRCVSADGQRPEESVCVWEVEGCRAHPLLSPNWGLLGGWGGG